MRKMDSDLVGSTSMQANVDQVNISIGSDNLVGSMGVLPTFSYSSSDNRVLITRNRSNNFPLCFQVSITFNQSKVAFLDRFLLQLLV